MTMNIGRTARLSDEEPATLGRRLGEYLIVASIRDLECARRLARGQYQLELLNGERSWSGAELKGKAGRYTGRYRASRQALLARITENGIWSRFVLTRTGRKILVLGEESAHGRLARFAAAAEWPLVDEAQRVHGPHKPAQPPGRIATKVQAVVLVQMRSRGAAAKAAALCGPLARLR